MIIIYLFIIFSLGFSISNLFNFSIEKGIFCSNAFLIIFVYILGLFNFLSFSYISVLGIGIASLLYNAYYVFKNGIKSMKKLFSLGTIIWVILLVVGFILTRNCYFHEWDEFSHWGTNLKAMYYKNILWANDAWEGVHIVYPPIMGVAEYIPLKFIGTFTEPMAYYSLYIFIVNLLIVVFSELKISFLNLFKSFILIFIVYLSIYIFGYSISSLYLDLSMGILFFISLYLALKDITTPNIMLFIISLFILTLCKEIGILLSGISVFCMFIKNVIIPIYNNKKIKKVDIKKLFSYIVLIVIILLVFGTWKVYCFRYSVHADYLHDSNTISSYSISEYASSIFIRSSNESHNNIVSAFYSGMNEIKITNNIIFNTVIKMISFICIVLLLLISKQKKKLKHKYISLLVTLIIGCVLYFACILFVYLFGLTDYEALRLFSFERYATSFLIAFWLCIIFLIFRYDSIIYFFLSFLICIMSINLSSLFQPQIHINSPISSNVKNSVNFINNKLEYDDKVFIICQDTDGYIFHQIRYLLSPIKTNLLYEWNLGEKNNVIDFLTLNISEEEFEQKLIEENYTYLYIHNSSQKFLNDYIKLFKKCTDFKNNTISVKDIDNKLFKINSKDGLSLSLVM